MAKDLSNSQPTKDLLPDAVIGLASPQDRLASYVLDCVILLPLVQLLQSPVKRWIFESILYDESAQVPTYRYINLVIFVVLFVAYYTFSHWFYGQSIGKRFFSLKVVSYKGRLSFMDSLQRSLATFFEFIFLGYPFIALFSHPLRRPFHDRVADTVVISKTNPSGFPVRTERIRARFVTMIYGFIICAFLFSYLFVKKDVGPSKADLLASEVCKKEVIGFEKDLEALLGMHLAQKIDADCLFELTRDFIWLEGESALSQFVMSTAVRENEDLSKNYLDSVCEANSNHHLCDLSKQIKNGNFFTSEGMKGFLDKLKDKKVFDFSRVMIAGSFDQLGQYEKVEEVLKPIAKPGSLRPLVASLYFRSLLGQLRWDEAKWVFKTHDEVDDQDILFFLRKQQRLGHLSDKQKLQLLDYFYPQLVNRESTRQPASLSSIPEELEYIYMMLEAEQ